jgi:hypothetical protein
MRNQSEPVNEHQIHRDPKRRSSAEVDGAVTVTGFTLGGVEVDATNLECVAKKAFDPATGSTRFWIKRATAGPDAGHLFNPQSPMFEPASIGRVNDALGRGQYEFRTASEEQFDLYLNFLRTNNPSYVRHAERCV